MIALRDFQDDDAERLYRWRREPEVDRWMYERPPEGFDAHLAWFAGFRSDPDRRGLIIMLKDAPCGSLTLTDLKGSQARAKLDWYVGEASARGRGAGRAAQALGVELAFLEHGVQKVWSEVLADNDTALKAQSAAGFRREGYLRRHFFKHGVFKDVVLLAILQEEWAARRSKTMTDLAASGLIAAAAVPVQPPPKKPDARVT